ncbi:hypothetical protein OTU49_012789, partial [Cherax quadricarinatus]
QQGKNIGSGGGAGGTITRATKVKYRSGREIRTAGANIFTEHNGGGDCEKGLRSMVFTSGRRTQDPHSPYHAQTSHYHAHTSHYHAHGAPPYLARYTSTITVGG